ncbi:MAG: 30S ribosomal protein S15 [Candidatus Aenigmarchaeota archaeon]|nr:30S ribosomal protein S15 [Candidatus Aenigmarchaeota archaeon]
MAKRSKSPDKPSWVTHTEDEVEQIIEKLAKEGKGSAQIGLILRDQYGIPSAKIVSGKRISKIMKEKKLYSKLPEDLFNLLKHAVRLRGHLEKNKRDAHSKRGLEKAESRVRDLAKYYIKKGSLPADWKYDHERAKLLVQE